MWCEYEVLYSSFFMSSVDIEATFGGNSFYPIFTECMILCSQSDYTILFTGGTEVF